MWNIFVLGLLKLTAFARTVQKEINSIGSSICDALKKIMSFFYPGFEVLDLLVMLILK